MSCQLTHSALFWPVPRPTIETGVKATTAAVIELMGKWNAQHVPHVVFVGGRIPTDSPPCCILFFRGVE